MKIRINPVYGKEIKLKVRSVKFAIIIFLFNQIGRASRRERV